MGGGGVQGGRRGGIVTCFASMAISFVRDRSGTGDILIEWLCGDPRRLATFVYSPSCEFDPEDLSARYLLSPLLLCSSFVSLPRGQHMWRPNEPR